MNTRAVIAASWELVPRRYPELSGFGLFREIIKGALRDWRLSPKELDGLLCTPAGGASGETDAYVHDKLLSELGIHPTFCETLSLGGASHTVMVNRAATAIREGRASAVLCISAGKFLKPSAGGAEIQARMISDNSLEMPYGTFIPALYALIASGFIAERGLKPEHLARVGVSSRKWALLNPRAMMHSKGPITVEDVLNSQWIAEPFHFLDCSIPTDGGGAFLVTREDLAKKYTSQPAYILGYGEYHARGTLSDPGDPAVDGPSNAGAQAFRQAGLTPADIDVVQLYDAFAATPLILLETLGFCAPGTSGAFVMSGATEPGGKLPMNTGGGLMSFGHTGDSSGMSPLIEGMRQVMGVAGPNQVTKANRVLVHCYGGMMFDHATLILGRQP